MASGKDAVAKAKSQNGISEVGYTNRVKFNDWYYGREIAGSAYPWCAAFTSWVYDEIGLKADVEYPKSAGVAVCFAWYRRKGRIINKRKLKAGDQVRYTFSHTGIFSHYDSRGNAVVWEGNTSGSNRGSQRDGGGVHLRTRPLSLIQYGGRPYFGETEGVVGRAKDTAKGIFGMAMKAVGGYEKNQKVRKGKANILKTGKYSFFTSVKKGETLQGTVDLRLNGMRENDTAEVWILLSEYVKKQKKGYHRYNYDRLTVHGRTGGGDVHVKLPFTEKVNLGPKHGGDLRLYVIVKPLDGDATVEKVYYRILGD